MIERSYYNASAKDFVAADEQTILGALTGRSSFAVDPQQRDAWVYTIRHLQSVLPRLDGAHVFLEFTIPRMGRRVDAIVIYRGILFVLEYKVGEADFSTSAIDQAVGYALDLKNFHEASHDRTIVPIGPSRWPVALAKDAS